MFDELRSKYKEFIYESYSYEFKGEDLFLEFIFNITPDITFHPSLIVKNVGKANFSKLDKNILDNLVFHIGLSEIPSYWKTTCSERIFIKAGYLNPYQISFWHKLFIKGMGQYFYENNIDFTQKDLLTIKINAKEKEYPKATVESKKVLVPVGGGKDSTVTLELLKKKYSTAAFLVNEIPASNNIVELAQIDSIHIQRQLDSKLFELNRAGFLNGHVPITATLSFISLLTAYVLNFKTICFSNEASSNEGNTVYLGHEINHQYSKTIEFENDLRSYNAKYLTDICYLSFLRPLNELQIAKLFANMPTYHPLFRSCNVGRKKGEWCNTCPKCLSTFILLYSFLGPEKTESIFGKNLYADESLFPLLITLIDETKVKPFECVGTYKELAAGLYLSQKWHTEGDMPALLVKVSSFIAITEIEVTTLLSSWEANNLDKTLELLLRKNVYA